MHLSEPLPTEYASIAPPPSARLRAQLGRYLRGCHRIAIKQEIEGAKNPKTRNSINLSLRTETSMPDEPIEEIAVAILRVCHYVWAEQEPDDDDHRPPVAFAIECEKKIRGKRSRPAFAFEYSDDGDDEDDELAATVSYELQAAQSAIATYERLIDMFSAHVGECHDRFLSQQRELVAGINTSNSMLEKSMGAWVAAFDMQLQAAKSRYDRDTAEAQARAGIEKWEMIFEKVGKAAQSPIVRFAIEQLRAARGGDVPPGPGRPRGGPAPAGAAPAPGAAGPAPGFAGPPPGAAPTEADFAGMVPPEEATPDELQNPLRTLVTAFVSLLAPSDHASLTTCLDAQEITAWWHVAAGSTDAEIRERAAESIGIATGLKLNEWRKRLSQPYLQEQLAEIYAALQQGGEDAPAPAPP